jgi:parvulin-like peptidyl-prolyl isomerase
MALEVKMGKLIKTLDIKEATDKDALDFYNKNKAQFTVPERVKVSHILIETNPEAIKRKIAEADKTASMSTIDIDNKVKEEVARKENLAKEVLAKAKANPKDFAKLAQEYSDDTASAKNGGDLGFVVRTSVVKEFGDAAFSQKVGVVGPLVKTTYGEHIILVKDKAKAGTQPFDEVKNDLKAFLSQQMKGQKIQEFIEGLKNKATIEYVDESFNPDNIKAQFEEAIKKQIEQEEKKAKENQEQKPLEQTEGEQK